MISCLEKCDLRRGEPNHLFWQGSGLLCGAFTWISSDVNRPMSDSWFFWRKIVPWVTHGFFLHFPYCKGIWMYSQNIEPEGHAVRMHVAWFLTYSSLESGQVYIELWAVNIDGGYYL